MAYQDHFALADDLIAHLNGVVGAITDPLISVKYVGFVAVVSVAVYELAVKEIFIDFADRKHRVFGSYAGSHYRRLNGRITISDLMQQAKRYGDKYEKRFNRKLDEAERKNLRANNLSIRTSYGNIITWRHSFAHEGVVPTTTTYNEVTGAYSAGKEVIHCLAESMWR
jgi:hypothetical protein